MQDDTINATHLQEVSPPDPGEQVIVTVIEGVTLDFLFDPVDVSFEPHGADAVLNFENGGSVVLANISEVNNPPDFPFVRLQDGSFLSQGAFTEAATGLSNIITEGGLVF